MAVKKVGLVGCGTMGGFHAGCYQQIPDCELAGIYDIAEDKRNKFAEEFKIKPFSSYDEMLQDEGIDIIDICLPTPFHKEYVLKAAKSKKNIFCEKPIARNLEDGKIMVESCKNAKVKFMVGHVLRYFNEYAKAKEVIDSGGLGKIGIVRATRGGAFPHASNEWYADYQMSGGLVLDMIVHDFDFLRWCFGDVQRVYAKGMINKGYKFIDYALVTLRFKSGVIAHVEGTWAHPGGFRTRLEVAGSKGLLNFDSKDSLPINIEVKGTGGGGGVAVPESPVKESPYLLELRHFVDCVINNKEPDITGKDALKALEISLAALKSIETGKPIVI